MKKLTYFIAFLSLTAFFLSSFTNKESKGYEDRAYFQDLTNGKLQYERHCLMCHKQNGEGVAKSFPPLAKSDYLNADSDRAIRIVLYGLYEPIVVNGKPYENYMIPHKDLSDKDIADILTYVYESWGNNKTKITVDMVKKQRTKK
ncbi:c-type cytochrome [Flavobacterium ardleyense]|uniref:C-type cytochrome n=1 Tax=Flavobacterium ardleyense TaxID=2038737 RepID=A0ABW5ZBT2_9FLAO